ncbi:MAG: hypothetical protein ABSA21_06835 [Candidatus Limnocylindrales bacterium]
MSVIVGISADSDFVLANAGYRVLKEIAFSRTDNREDRRILEAAGWAHILDLTTLKSERARRIAWLLDEAAQIRIEALQAEEGTQESPAGAAHYEAFQAQLRKAFGRPPDLLSRSGEPALRT